MITERSGPLTLTFPYDDTGLTPEQEQALRLFHWVDDAWVDVTTALDTEANLISGEVTSLSWFGIARALDTTPPQIVIEAPAADTEYLVGAHVSVSWWATDSESGVAQVSGTTADGAALSTDVVGLHDFTVTAIDHMGNEATGHVTYRVVYGFSGLQQPVNADGSSIFKLGSTVPVKFGLFHTDGTSISTAVARVYIAKVSNQVVGTELESTSSSQASTGNEARWDGIAQQYVFNMSTRPLDRGTWRLRIALDDGKSYSVLVSLR